MVIRTDFKEFTLLIEFSDEFDGEKENLQHLLEKYTERWKNSAEIVLPDATLVQETSWISYVTAELLNDCKWLRWARVANEQNRTVEDIVASLDDKAWHSYDGECAWPRLLAVG